jgi:hypothetical protein
MSQCIDSALHFQTCYNIISIELPKAQQKGCQNVVQVDVFHDQIKHENSSLLVWELVPRKMILCVKVYSIQES